MAGVFLVGIGYFAFRNGQVPTLARQNIGVVRAYPGASSTAIVSRPMDRRCRGGCFPGGATGPALNGWWLFYKGIGNYAPASGAALSMTNLQSGAAQAVADSRAGNKTCTSAPGAVSILANDTPCVETAGLLVEGADTNQALWSQNLSHAPWGLENVGIALPVVTANTGDVTAPDGTSTATKIVFPASTATGQLSDVKQNLGTSALVSRTLCLYLRGTGTQTFYFGFDTSAQYVTAGLTASWQRFTLNASSTGQYISIGTDTRAGNLNEPLMSGQTVYVWGVQASTTANTCSSYIPTTTSTVTRVVDSLSFSNPLASATTYAIGATLQSSTVPFATTCHTLIAGGAAAAANSYEVEYGTSSQDLLNTWDGSGVVMNFSQDSFTTPTPVRLVWQNSNGSALGWSNGSAVTVSTAGLGAGIGAAQPATIYLGARSTGAACNVNGYMTDMCIANDSSGCTP